MSERENLLRRAYAAAAFEELPDGRMSVRVHQRVRTPDGEPVSDTRVTHVYEFAGDRVARMNIT